MQLTISKSICDYWNTIRGDQPVPSRAALQPGPISYLLPDLFILQWEADGEISFRLAGTRVSTILGAELASQPFACVWDESDADAAAELVRSSASSGKPLCLDVRGFRTDYPPLAFEMVLLPLMDAPPGACRMLGALAPHYTSSWQLLEPVDSLRLEAVEVIDGDAPQPDDPGNAPEPAGFSGLLRLLMPWRAAGGDLDLH